MAAVAATVLLVTRGGDDSPLPDGLEHYASTYDLTLASGSGLGEGFQDVSVEAQQAVALTLDVVAGDVLRVRTEIRDEADDPVLAFFDPDGNLLTEVDDSERPLQHDAILDWVVAHDGTHYVVMRDFDARALTVPIELLLPSVSELQAEQEASLDSAFELDVYSFDGPGEEFTVQATSDDTAIGISVLDPNGEVVSDDDSDGAAELHVPADLEGRYLIVVETTTEPGNYTLTADGL